MSVALLREMFDRMVVAKNAELIEHYYDPDFLMYSDGLSQSFAKFRDSHRKLLRHGDQLRGRIRRARMGRGPDKVAGRVWITTSRPGEEPTRIEVVLIAAYRNGRIHRIWETTWPSWRNVAALDDY